MTNEYVPLQDTAAHYRMDGDHNSGQANFERGNI